MNSEHHRTKDDARAEHDPLERRLRAAFESDAGALPAGIASAVAGRRAARRVRACAAAIAACVALGLTVWAVLPIGQPSSGPGSASGSIASGAARGAGSSSEPVHAWSLVGMRLAGDVLPGEGVTNPAGPDEPIAPTPVGVFGAPRAAWGMLPPEWRSGG
ncbi:MAG: hypothetical protein AAF356_06115 [Planctomycetota bacterium]